MAIDSTKRVVRYEIEIIRQETIILAHDEYLRYLESLNNSSNNNSNNDSNNDSDNNSDNDSDNDSDNNSN